MRQKDAKFLEVEEEGELLGGSVKYVKTENSKHKTNNKYGEVKLLQFIYYVLVISCICNRLYLIHGLIASLTSWNHIAQILNKATCDTVLEKLLTSGCQIAKNFS